jgi:hypothetical protein
MGDTGFSIFPFPGRIVRGAIITIFSFRQQGRVRNRTGIKFGEQECRIPQGHSLRVAELCTGSTNYLISVVVVVLVRFSSLLGLSVVVVVFRWSWCFLWWWCFRFSLVVVVVF